MACDKQMISFSCPVFSLLVFWRVWNVNVLHVATKRREMIFLLNNLAFFDPYGHWTYCCFFLFCLHLILISKWFLTVNQKVLVSPNCFRNFHILNVLFYGPCHIKVRVFHQNESRLLAAIEYSSFLSEWGSKVGSYHLNEQLAFF